MNMYDIMSYKLQCFMNICQTWLALASKNRAFQFGNICDSSDDLWQAFANGHLCGIALPFHQEVPGGLASPEMASNVSFVKAVTLKGREKKKTGQLVSEPSSFFRYLRMSSTSNSCIHNDYVTLLVMSPRPSVWKVANWQLSNLQSPLLATHHPTTSTQQGFSVDSLH